MIQAHMFTGAALPAADHLLFSFPMGSQRVPSAVSYQPGRVAWNSSSVPSTERLRLSFSPVSVSAGGTPLPRLETSANPTAGWWTHNKTTGLVVVMHEAASDVVVLAQ